MATFYRTSSGSITPPDAVRRSITPETTYSWKLQETSGISHSGSFSFLLKKVTSEGRVILIKQLNVSVCREDVANLTQLYVKIHALITSILQGDDNEFYKQNGTITIQEGTIGIANGRIYSINLDDKSDLNTLVREILALSNTERVVLKVGEFA